MKIGLGLYRHMLVDENFRFAKQCGVTDIVAHLTDYFSDQPRLPGSEDGTWGYANAGISDWTRAGLRQLKDRINAHGLQLAALENFNPAHWHDVLLGGPKRDAQLDFIRDVIRDMGAVGIPVMGYNFSIAGVWGWRRGPFARGEAESVGLIENDELLGVPIPKGTVWNMVFDRNAPEGCLETVDGDRLWQNLEYFLNAVLPVAEEAGVTLAAHPDDPPLPTMRGHARLVYQPRFYDKLFSLRSSHANRAELCIGSLAEMSETNDIYADVERWSRENRVGYVHLRNVKGKVPSYREVFIDEGDVDVLRIVSILKSSGFSGVVIPDHTPQLSCEAPWHAGMAFALGYMNAAFKVAGVER